MKKIFLFLTVITMVFTSCEPLEDINEEIDALTANDALVEDLTIVLSDDDYETLELSFGTFSSEEDAKDMLPEFLESEYPLLGVTYNTDGSINEASSALVTYKLYLGNAFSVENYTLTQEDYDTSGSELLGFESDLTPEDYLVDIITDRFPSQDNGDYVAVQYFQFTGNAFTVTPEISLEENFNYGTTAGDLTTVSSGAWVSHSGASNQLQYVVEGLSMTDYPSSNIGGAMAISTTGSEDVNHAISPILDSNKIYSSALIKLSEVGDGTYFFHLMEEDGSFNFSARTGAKSDGAGKVLFGIGASSSSLTYGTTAYDLDTTYLIVTSYEVETGISNLYVLTSVVDTEPASPEASNTNASGNSANRIGVRQGGGGPSAIIDGIRVANTWSSIMTNDTLGDEVIGDKSSNTVVYTYEDNAWSLPSDNGFYYVTESDFASMGIENFGSSTPADNYLSKFLDLKFPYELDSKELNVLYKYVSSSSGEQTRGSSYTKTDGIWEAYESTQEVTLQFGHDGTTWVPDNTIKYTLVSEDYTAIGNSSVLTSDSTFTEAIGNLNNFGNFNRTGGSTSWSDEMMITAIGVFLDGFDATAEEGQKYVVTVSIYDGSSGNEAFRLIKEAGAWVAN